MIDTVEERGRFIDVIDRTTVTLGPCSLEDHHSPTNPPPARMGDRITVESLFRSFRSVGNLSPSDNTGQLGT